MSQSFEEVTLCILCMESLSAEDPDFVPRSFPCGHSLVCTRCCYKLYDNGAIKCPQCQGITKYSHPSNIPKDFTLMTILSRLNLPSGASAADSSTAPPAPPSVSSRNIKCENLDEDCENKAEKYCSNCDMSFCELCVQSIHKPKMMQFHKLGPLENKKPKCSVHPDCITDIFCKDDKVLICYQCHQFGQHKGHEISTVSEAATAYRDELQLNLQFLTNSLNNDLKLSQNKISQNRQAMKNSMEESVVAIRADFIHAIAELEAKQTNLLQELKQPYEYQLAISSEAQVRLENVESLSNALVQDITNTLDTSGDDYELLARPSVKPIMNQLTKLKSTMKEIERSNSAGFNDVSHIQYSTETSQLSSKLKTILKGINVSKNKGPHPSGPTFSFAAAAMTARQSSRGSLRKGRGEGKREVYMHKFHHHKLQLQSSTMRGWHCDGRGFEGGCRGDGGGGSQARYRCDAGCDFDLCQACLEGGSLPGLYSKHHMHNLALTDRNTNWFCDGRNFAGGCSGENQNGKVNNFASKMKRFRCIDGCDFDLCESCMEIKVEHSKHAHPLVRKNGGSTSTTTATGWICDGRSCIQGGCQGVGGGGFDARYTCVVDCNFDLCQYCVEVGRSNSRHEHPLQLLTGEESRNGHLTSASMRHPTAGWCCDGRDFEGGCRGDGGGGSQARYWCNAGCDFDLCQACMNG